MSISSFFGLLLLLSLPLSPALTPYFVYFFDLILFTIFLFFWPPFSAWIYHSPLKGEWFLLRSPPLLLAVRHSRRVPPSPSSLSLPFPRSFPPLPRFSPLFFAWSNAPPSPSFFTPPLSGSYSSFSSFLIDPILRYRRCPPVSVFFRRVGPRL